MIKSLPIFISIIFILNTCLTLWLFYHAISRATTPKMRNKAVPIIFALTGWLIVQAALALIHVYSDNSKAVPPKLLVLGILPALVVIALTFLTRAGRNFIDSLPLSNMTWIHVVRIPVEIGLLVLFIHKAVPQAMTFEGRNFDILSGLTAPFIAYFGFTKNKLKRPALLLWNFICLGLLFNIVITAILSAPLAVQRFAFDQPNIAILHFPFCWLPVFIVPVVLFSHLVTIRQLILSPNS